MRQRGVCPLWWLTRGCNLFPTFSVWHGDGEVEPSVHSHGPHTGPARDLAPAWQLMSRVFGKAPATRTLTPFGHWNLYLESFVGASSMCCTLSCGLKSTETNNLLVGSTKESFTLPTFLSILVTIAVDFSTKITVPINPLPHGGHYWELTPIFGQKIQSAPGDLVWHASTIDAHILRCYLASVTYASNLVE